MMKIEVLLSLQKKDELVFLEGIGGATGINSCTIFSE
jgi:hypothetical protein